MAILPHHKSTPKDRSNRRMTVYQTRPGRPRWILHMQAVFWRVLMNLGMFFHRLARPRPPKPDFSRAIPSTISGTPGWLTLNFYVPADYETQKRLWVGKEEAIAAREPEGGSGSSESSGSPSKGKEKARRLSAISSISQSLQRRNSRSRRWGGYPVVINFHGGGFTLGNSHDDARWCGTVVDECHAVVISVDYRLAPECPFPTAVEDGVDAVVYVNQHAEELGIDRNKIALSGFSSGGNMCFTVPLRLYDEMQGFPRDDTPIDMQSTIDKQQNKARKSMHSAPAITPKDAPNAPSSSDTPPPQQPQLTQAQVLDSSQPPPTITAKAQKSDTMELVTEYTSTVPTDIRIACLIPWYPPVDYTRTREQRRATCRRADQELPALFTDLFDDSYLHPPDTISLDSPYLSPGVAPTSLLRNALPEEIIMHTCEWDMLLSEGEDFRDRLLSPDLGKKVWYKMVEGVPHGWDKAPNPLKPTPGVREHYLQACKEMRRVFWQVDKATCSSGGQDGLGLAGLVRPPMERGTTVGGFPTVAPRGSIAVVR